MPTATEAVGIGVIVLFIAVAFPVFIAESDAGTITETATIQGGGESVDVGEVLSVVVNNKTDVDAGLTITELRGGESASVTLTEAESATVMLGGESVTVTLVEVQSGSSGDVTVELVYPDDLAWSPGARTFADELPLVLAAVALLIPVAMMIWVVK